MYQCVILMSLRFFSSLNFACQIIASLSCEPVSKFPPETGVPVMHFRYSFQLTSVPKQRHLKRVLGKSDATVCVTFYAVMRCMNRWGCGPINVWKPFCIAKMLGRHYHGYVSHNCKAFPLWPGEGVFRISWSTWAHLSNALFFMVCLLILFLPFSSGMSVKKCQFLIETVSSIWETTCSTIDRAYSKGYLYVRSVIGTKRGVSKGLVYISSTCCEPSWHFVHRGIFRTFLFWFSPASKKCTY